MKSTSLLLAVVFALLFGVAAHADEKATIEASIGPDETTKSDTLAADVAKVYASFKVAGAKSGDKVRSVWIAEDVGAAAPKETKIDEATLPVDKADIVGTFSLSKPNKGWPLGKYRVDLYLNETLTTSVKFTIAAAEKPADEAKP